MENKERKKQESTQNNNIALHTLKTYPTLYHTY